MIKFYIDGTAGQKDGTEVTSINPITATGLFPSGGTEATKIDCRFGGDVPTIVTINFYLKCPIYQPGTIDLPVTFKISDFKTEELTFYTKVNSTVGVPVNLYAETVYTITVQDDRFLPILEDTVFHADVDYLILLDLI